MKFLSVLLYDFALWLYATGIKIYSPFNTKAKLWSEGRKNIFRQIAGKIILNEKIIWMHCASVGEFEQGRPVLEMLKEKFPTYRILLTFFSPSAYELRKNFTGADYIFYLPLDSKRNAKKFIRIVQPQLAVFVKYEFWYHYLYELHQRSVPTLLISAIFRKEQLFFRWYGKFFLELLRWYKQIFVQDKDSFQLLKDYGVNNVTLSSDTRFDRVTAIAAQAKSIPLIDLFKGDNKILIGGSTWPKDEKLLIRFINNSEIDSATFRFIIVPHEINASHIQSIRQKLSGISLLFSELNEENATTARTIIVDNVGMLSSLYRYAAIAYIGGGFGKGIHNILEAAVYGVPVIFGPNYSKFKEAVDLTELGGGFSINSYDNLSAVLHRLITDKEYFNQSSAACRSYLQSGTGAVKQIADYLKH